MLGVECSMKHQCATVIATVLEFFLAENKVNLRFIRVTKSNTNETRRTFRRVAPSQTTWRSACQSETKAGSVAAPPKTKLSVSNRTRGVTVSSLRTLCERQACASSFHLRQRGSGRSATGRGPELPGKRLRDATNVVDMNGGSDEQKLGKGGGYPHRRIPSIKLGGCRAKPGIELEHEHQAEHKDIGQRAAPFEEGVGPYAEEGGGRFVAGDEKNNRHPLSVLEGGSAAGELIL